MIKEIFLSMFEKRYSYIQLLTFLIASAVLHDMIQKGEDASGWIWFIVIVIVGNAINLILDKDDSTD